jgi:hypothetical protein
LGILLLFSTGAKRTKTKTAGRFVKGRMTPEELIVLILLIAIGILLKAIWEVRNR